jgi:predicted metallopeptidase
MKRQTPTTPKTALYMLVAERLGRDPIDLIRQRRSEGVAFARITDEIKAICNQLGQEPVYLTLEAPRRWLAWSDQQNEASKAA